jgi:protein phosphatase
LDGIGGHAGGCEASRIVLEQLRTNIESMCAATASQPDQDLRLAVSNALKFSTKSMLQFAVQKPDFDKMGTVFALAYVIDGMLLYTHVGDCRVYLVRRGKSRQLTSDETYVQLMVDAGVIGPDEVPDHPMRNVILNAVGTRSTDGDPVVHTVALLPEDTVLLTTDGVTDALSDEEMVSIIQGHPNPDEAAKALVRAAIDAGSRDNASCVVVAIDRVEETDPSKGQDDLHIELAKLHEMLSDVQTVDEELRSDMVRIAEDIRQALGKNEPKELSTLGKRLENRALEFEVSHPRLTAVVASITDMLSQIGI